MAWIYLIVAGLLEVVWAVLLKRTEGFTKLGPSVITLLTMIASFYLLSVALKTLPTGTGYAVWVGIGAVGTAIFGILYLGEPATALRLASIGLIILGVIGLRLAEGRWTPVPADGCARSACRRRSKGCLPGCHSSRIVCRDARRDVRLPHSRASRDGKEVPSGIRGDTS